MNRSKRMDNRGLTLVELLVAITVLAIIVVPLLHAFVTSARVNAESKKKLRITAMTQDIMEGLKAYSVEELAYEFNYPTASSNIVNPLGFQVVDPSLIDGGADTNVYELTIDPSATNKLVDVDTDKSISNYGVAGDVEHKFVGQSSGKYYFAIKNMNVTDTDAGRGTTNSSVDILITADALSYRDAPAAVSHNSAKHNSKQLIDIPMMDSYVDSFYIEDTTSITNEKVAQYFKNNDYAADPGKNVEYILKKMKKTITIEVSKTSNGALGGTKDRYEVDVKTEFKLIDGLITDTYPTVSSLAFDNIMTGEQLKNVYLFYKPIYHNDYSDIYVDELVYKPAADINTNWYIVKQGSDSALPIEEENYKCKVKVQDDRQDTVNAIRSNLDFNTVTNTKITPGKTDWSGIGSIAKQELFGDKTQDRLFKCTVYVFPKGTVDSWLTGNAFDLSDALTHIEGNMK